MPTPGVLGKKHTSKVVEFKAADGLSIHGSLYEIDKHKPVILLMHQAGYNNFEYSDITLKLNEIGYNCLAVDLRSGGTFAGESNNTFTYPRERITISNDRCTRRYSRCN